MSGAGAMNGGAFAGYHPAVNFLWFGLVFGFTMFFFHPRCLAISLLASISYHLYLKGEKAARFQLRFMLPLLIVTALLNPAFNHDGVTILAYLPGGNPLTLESICYGLAAAMMLIAAITWFGCYNAIMTADKFIYLFGRVVPALSLIISMTLRFVPRLQSQLKQIAAAQRGIMVSQEKSRGLQRLKNGLTVLSALITWSLENAIETGDSMKARGYGLPGRTAFSIYNFNKRDQLALGFFILCGGYVFLGAARGAMSWQYSPALRGAPLDLYAASVFAVYLLLCLTPLLLDLQEERKWKASSAKI